MSKDENRVPRAIGEFNGYVNDTNDRLQATNPDTTNQWWKDYGLTSTEAGDWDTKRKYWHDTLYPAYLSPLTSTSAIKEKVRKFIPDFAAFAAKPLEKIVLADVSGSDEERIFRVKIERAKPVHHSDPIPEACNPTAKSLGSGNLKVYCKTTTDASRASLPKRADSVQIAYKIDGTPPTSQDDGTTKEVITKAMFTLLLGNVNAGKKIYIYVRWFDTKHPNLAGGWSAMLTTNI